MLDASRIASPIRVALITAGALDNSATSALANAIASAIVTEIRANAVVIPTLLVAPPGGGPVTGTGVIT